MFWSANFIVVRELNVLLEDENVTLTQVLEADDILQECKADNKALMQFLTKPKILAELITLITEEPPKNVELASQYRHASIACEVLTSHLSTLSDHLSMDVVQMNRLCNFINKDPPLNPLLASYFSKTIEMLLERDPKQDWYLYHVGCLRVLDFFKSRRDFLPNLLRHISTSAIADTFKYFIRLDDLFNKIITEWFEEHQFLECLIQIICGTYVPEPLAPTKAEASPDQPEKGQHEASEKVHDNHTDGTHEEGYSKEDGHNSTDSAENSVEEAKEADEESSLSQASAGVEAGAEVDADVRASRIAAVASANAAALLCDLILSGCAGDGCITRPRTSWALVSRLQSADVVRQLLQGMFTAPPAARPHALVHGVHVLLALLDQEPARAPGGAEGPWERSSVELAVAPHLPLLHQALLRPPPPSPGAPAAPAAPSAPGALAAQTVPGAHAAPAAPGTPAAPAAPAAPVAHAPRVGLARVQVAALLAQLALSEVHDVCSTMLTLDTPGVLLQLFFEHPDNNLLHAQVAALLRHALANRLFRGQYTAHLLVECDLLTRLLDVFEENENNKGRRPRSGYMGHVLGMLRQLGLALDDGGAGLLPPALLARWTRVRAGLLQPLLLRHDTALGGYYPSDNVYEYNDNTATGGLDDIPNDINADGVDELCSAAGRHVADDLDMDDDVKAETDFLELASQRFGDDMWEDSPEGDEPREDEGAAGRPLLDHGSPWAAGGGGAGGGGGGGGAGAGGEGWAQFEAGAGPDGPPADPFWAFADDGARAADGAARENMEEKMLNLHLEEELLQLEDCSVQLATKLLTAMSAMAPEEVADIVNCVPLAPLPPAPYGGCGGPAPEPAPAPAAGPAAGPPAPAPAADGRR